MGTCELGWPKPSCARAHRSIIIDRAAAHSHFRPSLIGIFADTKGAWRPFPKAHLKIGVTDLFTSTASLISSKYQAVAKLCVLVHLTTLSSFLPLAEKNSKTSSAASSSDVPAAPMCLSMYILQAILMSKVRYFAYISDPAFSVVCLYSRSIQFLVKLSRAHKGRHTVPAIF